MKAFFKVFCAIMIIAVTSFSALSVGQFAMAEESNDHYLFNPYEGVDFSSVNYQRANMHAHSSVFEGTLPASEMIEIYKGLGYDYFVLTEHDIPSPATGDPVYGDVDFPVINGEEFSFIYHHMNAYFTQFSSVNQIYSSEIDLIADAVKANPETRYVLNHPGRHHKMELGDDQMYNVAWYLKMYNTYPQIVGMEVYNKKDSRPNDRILYDKVLTELMPYRPVWASAGDDNHGNAFGYSFATMLGKDNSVEEWKRCLEQGHFFASSFAKYTPEDLEVGGKPGDRFNYTPKVTNIVVDRTAQTIELTAENYTKIEWITEGGKIVGNETKINYSKLNKYVRAQLYYYDGDTFVCTTMPQPFGIGEYKENTFWDLYKPVEEPEIEAVPLKTYLIAMGIAVGVCVILSVGFALLTKKRR